VQFLGPLYTDDSLEWELTSQQQRFALSGAEIDKDKVFVSKTKSRDHVSKDHGVNRLIEHGLFRDGYAQVAGFNAATGIHTVSEVKPVGFVIADHYRDGLPAKEGRERQLQAD
jgi:hypothetical protein